MIVSILCLILVVAAFICLNAYKKERYPLEAFTAVTVILVVCATAFFTIVATIFIGNCIYEDIDYQSTLYEKEVIEYRLDKMSDNVVGNEMLYNDVIEFNNELRRIKKWANNPWVNLFYNQKIASIDYIEIGE